MRRFADYEYNLVGQRRRADEKRAHLRLITAAPNLLRALRSCETCISEYLNDDWDGNVEGWNAQVDAIHAAIAKAEGTS